MCLRKTLNVIFFKWRIIRASTTSNLHIWTISSGNSLCSHGNPTQLTNMLMNKTKEMASQYEWHSYCSSIWKYDNQCFWDALWLYYSTCVHNYGGTFAWVTNWTLKWMLPQHGQLCICRIMGPWPKNLHSQNSNRVKQVAFYNKILQLRLD